VAILGFAFMQASVTAKIVNLATNLGAIVVFGYHGKIMWLLGLTMAIGNITGGFLGARWAMRGGSALIRRVFLLVTALLIIRLAFDTFF
ncbi:MAG: sulfite exporter TauE/SafE family protein, partial [Actinobacteria bacterium]|nr:sulfite exporter TauE/SafE family protein [Actinomycetota bacterium]